MASMHGGTQGTLARSTALALGLAMTLAGCITTGGEAPSRHVADGTAFAMQPQDRVTLADGSVLHYTGVLSDSRCPPDVQCVWAGDAEVAMTRTDAAGATAEFVLHTGRGTRSVEFAGRRLQLLDVARGAAPRAQLRIDAAGTRATP